MWKKMSFFLINYLSNDEPYIQSATGVSKAGAE